MQYSADAVLSSPVLASALPQSRTIRLEAWFEWCEDTNRRHAPAEVTHEAAELCFGSMERRRRPWRASPRPCHRRGIGTHFVTKRGHKGSSGVCAFERRPRASNADVSPAR